MEKEVVAAKVNETAQHTDLVCIKHLCRNRSKILGSQLREKMKLKADLRKIFGKKFVVTQFQHRAQEL